MHSLKDRPDSARAPDAAPHSQAPRPRSGSARDGELADHDGAFSGTPDELEAILEGRGRERPQAPPRWRPGATLAFAVGVSLALWAGILLLLR